MIDNIPLIEIFCDESGQELLHTTPEKRKARYFGIGAIRTPESIRLQLKQELRALSRRHRIPWEFKWRKLSSSNLAFYLDVAEWFFESPLQFRLVRIDTKDIDLEFWHERDPELGFYKFYYQCLKHILCENVEYRVFTDYKTNRDRSRLERLKFFLNFYSPGNVLTVQALASKDSVFIQLADLFTGAVVASHNQAVQSESKLAFCKYVAQKMGKSNLAFCSTRYGDPKFNVFCLDFGRKP